VRFSGSHFRCGEIEVHPKPVQPGGPPLWLGARGPDALARVAQLGCGAVVEADTDPSPFVAAWAAQQGDLAEARLAFLIGENAQGDAVLSQRIGSVRAARLDIWLECTGDPAALDGLMRRATALRAP
jgi:hypothetical protein